MTPTDAAWPAGFLDGEGSFMVTRRLKAWAERIHFDATVAATNTDRRLVDRCAAIAGAGKVATTIPQNPRHRTAHIWTVRGLAVAPLVEAVLPYLVSKREQAQLLLDLRAMTKVGSPKGQFGTRQTPEVYAARMALYERAQLLNRRGRQEVSSV